MKALKYIMFAILGLIILFLIAGLFIDTEYHFERSTLIDAPPKVVFDEINNLETWETWSAWSERDTTITMTMGEKTSGTGAFYTWVSEESGSGKLTIVEAEPYRIVRTQVDFEGMGSSPSGFELKDTAGMTRITWDMDIKVPYPFNTLAALNGFDEINEDYERGLELLKERIESRMADTTVGDYTLQKMVMPRTRVAGIRDAVTFRQLDSFFNATYEDLGRRNLMQGIPMALFYNWDEVNQATETLVGYEVKEGGKIDESLTVEDMPESKAVMIEYTGEYDQSYKVHEAINKYLTENDLDIKMPIIEKYLVAPPADTSEWRTQVIYLFE